jgi:hypothetical protein
VRTTALAILVGTVLGSGAILCLEVLVPASKTRLARSNVIPPSPEVVAIQHRLELKCRLARQLVFDPVPLLSAAEMFRAANGEGGMDVLVQAVPGRSVREKLCRQVIHFVSGAEWEMACEGRSLPDPRASAALQAELDRLLAAGELPPEPGLE